MIMNDSGTLSSVPVMDVAEACADALLAASALAALVYEHEPTIDSARTVAVQALDAVIERSLREGAKPR